MSQLKRSAHDQERTTVHADQKRVSKHTKGVSTLERQAHIERITSRMHSGAITHGQALKQLRQEVLGLQQQDFAALVKISRKTLSDVENDRGTDKITILNKIFKPFGLVLGLVPISRKR